MHRSGRIWGTYVVIDTDVASKILKHQLTDDLGVKLAGATLGLAIGLH
jgi:hypothetical protein